MEQDNFPIRPYTPKELAASYRCSEKTFRKWIVRLQKDLGPRTGNLFTPRQVKIILQQLGTP